MPASSTAPSQMPARTATASPSARPWRRSATGARPGPDRSRSRPCSSSTSSRADPGGRWQDDRDCAGRAGRALVRGRAHRAGSPYRLDPHGPAPQRASRRREADRARQCDRAGARAGRPRHGRPHRGQAELPQRHPGPRLPHGGSAPSGGCGAQPGWRPSSPAHSPRSRARPGSSRRSGASGIRRPSVDPDCIASVRRGVEKAGLSSRDIVSGAGHDAAYVSRVAPTTMIFVPSAGGLSHNEAEATSQAECGAGRAGAAQRRAGL